MMLPDSGERRQFDSGAVRDIAQGKGRCDLMPLSVVGRYIGQNCLTHIDEYLYTGEVNCLSAALGEFMDKCDLDPYTGFLEVAKHFEDGAVKYGDRNWEKGIPVHCYIDSAVRHYLKFYRGDDDEPHNRAFMWNILCAIWTHEHYPGLRDIPAYYPTKETTCYESYTCTSNSLSRGDHR